MSRDQVTLRFVAAAVLSAGVAGPAPAQNRGGFTPRDVLGAYGLGPNAGLGSGAPLHPRFSYVPPTYSTPRYSPNYDVRLRINDAGLLPPSVGTTSSPLFPYSSAGWPYGYGQPSREFLEYYYQPQDARPALEPAPPDPNVAKLDVRVPADAEVWVEGHKTAQTGPDRVYLSPPLEPGREYLYDVRARWTEGEKPVDRTQTVRVRAGQRLPVAFATQGPG
jgi:uncharacterized protein (TIGR03000 family)